MTTHQPSGRLTINTFNWVGFQSC